MKIKTVRAQLRNLSLKKPYYIANLYCDVAENVFLEIELENGIRGIGSANPAPEVVGETPGHCLKNCQSETFERLAGRDINDFPKILTEVREQFPLAPGTLAALDIALHDAFAQYRGLRVVDLYGQKIDALPTSVTIGIMPAEACVAEAEAFVAMGFNVLKIKTGMDVEADIACLRKLHERFGNQIRLRADANQGYSVADLRRFEAAMRLVPLELLEQPLPPGSESDLLEFPEAFRQKLVADESLKSLDSARDLALRPQAYGNFNIKLMKCGGIAAALEIANIASEAGINLFWGCNDESKVSIAAALHAAFACSHTRYLDLDGSFDLAEDLVQGGFSVENGIMRLSDKRGLGFV